MHTNEEIMTPRGVVMIGNDTVENIALLKKLGWGAKRIAKQLGISRNTVRRYLQGAEAAVQVRPTARRLDAQQLQLAQQLYQTTADGNAVVVHELLEEQQIDASLRTVQRALEPMRRQEKAAQLASARFETPPGQQLQIDFGERLVQIAGELLLVYFFVATLGFSRRTFVRASPSQRQDEWKLGLEGALRHFGGAPEVVVVDNARALVLSHVGDDVRVHPAFASFCADRGLAVYACKPYRARTKGKVESGVKFVKRNAIARRVFESFEQLEAHLGRWMAKADQRIHGTTHRRPIDLFHEQEAAALHPLREPALSVATQRLKRRVANDCHFDLDTVRYSVPHVLARRTVEVRQDAHEVVVWHQQQEVARHRRSHVPHSRVTAPEHFAGLLRPVSMEVGAPARVPELDTQSDDSLLGQYGRSLEQYAQLIGGDR